MLSVGLSPFLPLIKQMTTWSGRRKRVQARQRICEKDGLFPAFLLGKPSGVNLWGGPVTPGEVLQLLDCS